MNTKIELKELLEKCEMTPDEITAELKSNGLDKDNPFDLMYHFSLELARECLFAFYRLRSKEYPEQFHTKKENLNFYMNSISELFDKLSKISDDSLLICRETSEFYGNNSSESEFEKMNHKLIEFEGKMKTSYSECVPCRDDSWEQIRLGIGSDEYNRITYLRKVVEESIKTFVHFNSNYINSLCDILEHKEKTIDYGWTNTKEEYEEKMKFISEHNLTKKDVNYMISYYETLGVKPN